MAAVEQRQWWYRGTREICFSILRPFLPEHGGLNIRDVGCGTGGNLLELARYGRARGLDIDPLCVQYCRQKGLDVSIGTMTDLQQPPASLDLLTLFDVLTYAEPVDTVRILRGMAAAIKPGGLIAFREPAMAIAGGWHDRAVRTKQRFTTGSVAASLRAAGFEPLRLTYLNSVLFPPIVLIRQLQNLREPTFAKSDVEDTAEPLNSVLLGILRFERALLGAADLPFGVSLFAVARRT